MVQGLSDMVLRGMNWEFRGLRLKFIRERSTLILRWRNRPVHVAMCFQTDRVPVICPGGLTSTGLGPKANVFHLFLPFSSKILYRLPGSFTPFWHQITKCNSDKSHDGHYMRSIKGCFIMALAMCLAVRILTRTFISILYLFNPDSLYVPHDLWYQTLHKLLVLTNQCNSVSLPSPTRVAADLYASWFYPWCQLSKKFGYFALWQRGWEC